MSISLLLKYAGIEETTREPEKMPEKRYEQLYFSGKTKIIVFLNKY